MDKRKRWLFILTSCLSLVGVGFLSASMGTDYWVQAFPERNVDNNIADGANNVTDGDPGTKFKGYIHFGLFRGYKSLDHGLGIREGEIWMSQNAGETGLFDFGLWVSTVVFMALGIALGLVSFAFAALNAGTRPIETITGPMGLYLWNGLAVIFSLLAMILYVVLYFQDFKVNVLTEEDRSVYRWTTLDRAYLHYSFYFVLVATVLYALNILLIAVSGVEFQPIRYKENISPKSLEGVMMF